MCTARSVYGWDLVVTKQDGKIFLDRRDDSNFDLLTVGWCRSTVSNSSQIRLELSA